MSAIEGIVLLGMIFGPGLIATLVILADGRADR